MSTPEFSKSLKLNHGTLEFPVYMPDATFGVVRTVDSNDLHSAGIQALVMNTFHLMQRPGSSTIQSLGGLHRMSAWDRPIITDSGGFQAYSLIRQNPRFGRMDEKGITFQPEGSDRKFQLSPEKCIQLQVAYGSDVVICLDDCTHVDASEEEQHKSVDRTISWAKRCKDEFKRLMRQKKLDEDKRPLIFGVIQGGGIPALRKQCADALLEIGFDGFGFGGWPLDGDGNLLTDILAYTRSLVPPELPMHALGIGHPYNVVTCWDLGYGIFDCAMPTRDARHGRLYTFANPSGADGGLNGDWLRYLYINDERHIRSDQPISPYCTCPVCRNYSAGYLHHLFKLNDSLFLRLSTLHNLSFMAQLTDRIRLRPQ
ncbi:tRNA-guanine transglycosylase, queuosine-34-forming [Longilinea arvoryzae]|uniref:tRNA-guanine transglycosylase, queuosine-34-forming n=1 Tax=Longilinea arvoryzae TaxID=360412 RepID=A0A0S7BCP6_9CHLR|nr:tRNA guanosine(34) transglycosylase Tgt [Longilinea arvoryzae]GAP15527.1 tRNA-guanine transglycosylase, queuosine-34-forming [Longilinea arvoryzae]